MRRGAPCFARLALCWVPIFLGQSYLVTARSALLPDYPFETKYPWINRIQYQGKASIPTEPLGLPSSMQCSFRNLPTALRERAVLLAQPQFERSTGCGRCLTIRCSDDRCPRKTTIRAIAAGVCDDCPYGWLEMDSAMYYAVTGSDQRPGPESPFFNIEWQYADCGNDVQGDLHMNVARGSTRRWFAFNLENSADPIHKVTAHLPNQTRSRIRRDKRNRFVMDSEGTGRDVGFPLTFIVESQTGRELLFDLMELPRPGAIVSTDDQFGKTDEEYAIDVEAEISPLVDGAIPRTLQYKESTDFETKSTGTQVGDEFVYNLWGDGFIEGSMRFSENTRVHVRLMGQLGGDEPPRMLLSCIPEDIASGATDDEYVVIGTADVYNTEYFVDFTFGVSGQSETKILRIEFVNDYFGGPGQDRNLLVGAVTTTTTDVTPDARVEQQPTGVLDILQTESRLQLLRAAQFEFKTTGIASSNGDESWALWDPGYIETTMVFTRRTLLTLEMRADPLQGWPTIVISIGGEYHSSLAVEESDFRLYSVLVIGHTGQQPVKLSLASSYHDLDLEQSRFLHVRKVYTGPEVHLEVPGTTVKVSAAQFQTKIGTGHAITDSAFSFDGNGLIAQEFNFGNTGKALITLEMQSNFVEGWPIATIGISGRTIAVSVVDSPSFALYTYTIDGVTKLQTLTIEFDSALVDGLKYDSNSAKTAATNLSSHAPIGHRNLWVRNVWVQSHNGIY